MLYYRYPVNGRLLLLLIGLFIGPKKNLHEQAVCMYTAMFVSKSSIFPSHVCIQHVYTFHTKLWHTYQYLTTILN